MKVIAKHERDSIETELDENQIEDLSSELGTSLGLLFTMGVRRVELENGWGYSLGHGDTG
jgi:hypothetical protein